MTKTQPKTMDGIKRNPIRRLNRRSTPLPADQEPARSPARELDAQVGRAFGRELRETTARVRHGGALPEGATVYVYDALDPDLDVWIRLPAYSSDAGTIPALMAWLQERTFSVELACYPDECVCRPGSLYRASAGDGRFIPNANRRVTGRTINEALCRAVVALAAWEQQEGGRGQA